MESKKTNKQKQNEFENKIKNFQNKKKITTNKIIKKMNDHGILLKRKGDSPQETAEATQPHSARNLCAHQVFK